MRSSQTALTVAFYTYSRVVVASRGVLPIRTRWDLHERAEIRSVANASFGIPVRNR
jgi:hypothetical protein